MEKIEKYKVGILAVTLVACTTIAAFAYRSVGHYRSATLNRQQFSLAVQAISNVKPEMQSIYVISLGSFGKSAIPVLLRLMSSPAESPANSGAGIALQVMGDEALKELIRVANDDSLPTDYRKSAIAGLGKIGGHKAKETLLKIGENKKEINLLRDQSIKSLLNYSNLDNIEALWKLLESEDKSSGALYQSVMDIFFDISARIAATREPEISSGAKAVIVKGLESKKDDIRYFSVKLLGALKDAQSMPQIEKAAQTDASDYVKKEAADITAMYKALQSEPKK